MRTPFPCRLSQLLQEKLPELVAAQVSRCFEDNMPQFAVDSERSKQQRKVFTMPGQCCQCGGGHGVEVRAICFPSQSKVDTLLAAENYEAAFNEALAHSDLELVVHLCGTVNPEKLFDQPLLSQPVLLSLIQHLAVDLNNSLDLKLQ